jgi:hypothetical protein
VGEGGCHGGCRGCRGPCRSKFLTTAQ